MFAETYQTSSVTIRAIVSKITLSDASANLYKLYGSFDGVETASLELLMADDISREDVVVYFRIAQLSKTRTDETIDIAIEAESFLNTDQEAGTKYSDMLKSSKEPVISNITCLSTDELKIDYTSLSQNNVSFHLDYMMGKPVENINLIFFTAKWGKTEGLAPGLYTSKIILSYIIN